VTVPLSWVQPDAFTAPCASPMKFVVPLAVTCNVILAVGVPLCVRTQTLAVKLAPLASCDVTLWPGPFHEAVRPVYASERAPPWTTLVFEAGVPAPNDDQPVVPLSTSAFVRRFPLAARAGAVLADTAPSEVSVRATARPNERILRNFFLSILNFHSYGRAPPDGRLGLAGAVCLVDGAGWSSDADELPLLVGGAGVGTLHDRPAVSGRGVLHFQVLAAVPVDQPHEAAARVGHTPLLVVAVVVGPLPDRRTVGGRPVEVVEDLARMPGMMR